MNTSPPGHGLPRQPEAVVNRRTSEAALCTWCGRVLTGSAGDNPPSGDPAVIQAFAHRHGVTPLLDRARRDAAAPLSQLLPRLDTKAATAEDMARTHELAGIIAECRRHLDHPPMVIKGQALAHTLYDHPWQRPRGDVDLMVDTASLDGLSRILERQGYARAASVDGDLVLTQAIFSKTALGLEHILDVHWQVSNRPALAEAITYDELADSAVEVAFNHTSFPAPDRVNALLLACVHLAGHHLNEPRMIWLYDIHLLVLALSDGEYRRLVDRAAQQTVLQAACHAALSLTHTYLPGERTDALRRALDPGPSGRWPGKERYAGRLVADALAVGRGKRLRLLAQHLFPSTDYMTRRFNIRRRWQLPFWYGFRFIRALPKLFRNR